MNAVFMIEEWLGQESGSDDPLLYDGRASTGDLMGSYSKMRIVCNAPLIL